MKRISKRKILAAVLMVLVVFSPVAANAGVASIISLLRTITTTLETDIGQVLNALQTVKATLRNFEQQVVWPINLINQTRSFITSVRGRIGILADQVHQISNNSARLVNPTGLESLLRSRQSNSLAQIESVYVRVYQPLPQESDVSPSERNLIDVDDALAIGAMKTAMISDQASEQMLKLADRIEQQVAVTAPGTAPMLAAQAQVANLQNQAMLQRMLAAELRQEAGRLAHSNLALKRAANVTRVMRQHMQQVLSRP
jgi:hypothetical protein